MAIIFYKEIINNYKKLYESKEGYDVKIYAGEKPNVKEFHVHSLILKSQSKIFQTLLTKDIQKKDGYYILNLNNNSPKFVEIILSCMYSGSFDLTKLQNCEEIINLLLLSNELGFQYLVKCIQETLIENYDFIIKNAIEIIELTYQKHYLDNLWNFCLKKICDNPDHLFKSTKFLTFNTSILAIILKRDDFCIDNEIIVWENLLKWACGQNPVIQQDINKWKKSEFTAMKRRLSKFIPSIRFYHIPPEDFLLKVYPFKEILPNDLINNIFTYHMAPSKRQCINLQPQRKQPAIITPQYFNIFSSWIDKKNNSYYNGRNIPYKFNLLYSAGRDGNTGAAFHEKCDDKGPTIVVAKIANSEQIIGGYNPLDWKPKNSNHSNYNKSTKDSFIFSFIDRNEFQTAKVSYPIEGNHKYSICCVPDHGPRFGVGLDLVCHDNGNWASNSYTYSKIDIPPMFTVNDYEVYRVNRSEYYY
ncbi:unnamed protein product [Rhizophagus irregularis]|nr:unnamed protein product [Rhizophagus irregularis]